ncbi:alanine--tRNA ligase [bacterium]|nr:alanine--tRNA ligase [bacterium]MBT4251213.1 alanine--tRNA ligase [bacterium]MBT4597995.1 alanine--tRNA ligase [bacterium]MBT6753592.1 alanine--tRNA ligase [bacterium]MBT7037707.1 alanine--tRNA ligase [bacterium]
MFTADELREKYLEFFKEKNHAIIPSASIVPENDPTTLFITAGMHPLVPYLMGEKHPQGTRLVDTQKCIRTIDIDEVGDTTHHTFFEMLGNWSLGDYFKKEAIAWSWEFLTDEKWLGLDKNRIAVSVFEGENKGKDNEIPFDKEAYGVWKEIFEKNNLPIERITRLDREANWWGPAGETGPCGPDSEMFYWVGDEKNVPESFNDDNDSWVEIWNDVFMEYHKNEKGEYVKMEKQNVDTGMGLIRVLAALNGLDDNYKTSLFVPIIEKIEKLSGFEYGDGTDEECVQEKGQCWVDTRKSMRIIADHIKAAVFMIADGVEPANSDRGYILRRLIRRAVRQGHVIGVEENFTVSIAIVVQGLYENIFPEVLNKKVLAELEKEEEKFRKSLENGLKKFEKVKSGLTGKVAFDLFQTYGFPIEMIKEEAKLKQIKFTENEEREFEAALKKHQELSRTASAGMFKGGLADTGEETRQLHTVAHLMLSGLRKVLGEHVHQRGSNINGERVRFDFSHGEKMTDEEKKAVENYVNEAIEAKIPVQMSEMSVDEAKTKGAEGAFENKYGDVVKVFAVGEYSTEICGGPHVENTADIKGRFKIKKEQSSSSGVRRIKAILER